MNNTKKSTRVLLGVFICLFGILTAVSAEELTIVGTGSGTVILQAVADAFNAQHPDIAIVLPESIGSGGAIKAVGNDGQVLGRVSRGIKEKEQPYGLTYVPYAHNPIVFFVNTRVTVENLTVQQLLEIYSGKITNWQEVGGADAKIRVVTREEGDSSRDVLLALLPGFKELAISPNAKTTFSDPETEETVLNTPGAIAYGSYCNAKSIDVKVLNINGQSPMTPDYPYVGTLGVVYKAQNFMGAVKGFVEFATSEAAHEAINNAGGFPLQ